jgi:hypothetical protein
MADPHVLTALIAKRLGRSPDAGDAIVPRGAEDRRLYAAAGPDRMLGEDGRGLK